jgi:putative DNA primase/helicase
MITFREMAEHGWKLCAISPGSKAPKYASWNERPIPEDALDGIDGAGLLHSLSGTAALDIDSMPEARIWLAEKGVDLNELLTADNHVGIRSGRHDRAKLLYSIGAPIRTVQPKGSGLELRCATADGKSVQDILPPTVHMLTHKPYTWDFGITALWHAPPTVPAALLAAWRGEVGSAPLTSTSVAPPVGSADVDRLRALLAMRDPSCGYELWLKAGMALHHATGGSATGLAVWNEWSAKGKPYKGVDDLRAHWVSFSSGGGKRVVTAASLETEQPATADEFPLVEMDEVDEMVEKPKRGPRSPMALDQDRSGEPRSNAANACKVLSTWMHDGTLPLAYDEFLGRTTLDGKTLTDHDSENIWVMLQSKSGKLSTVSYDTTCHAINAAAHSNVVNCVKDWLTTLVWDGTPRLATWISSAFGSRQPSVYTAAVGRNWLVSMVARAFEAGCFVKSAIILESKQDVGKSTAFRALVPQRRWFAELLADSSTKDCEQQLRGLWLGEFAEGWFLKRTDVGRLKQFVANDSDRYRVTYGRNEQEHPRRCVFVVSLNPEHDMGYLKDQTGNCRFFPVKCTKIDIDFIKATRDQLFAEAVAEYKVSPCWWQWPEAEALAEQEARRVREPLADYISDIPPDYALKDKHERRFITTKIVFEHLRSSAHLDPTEFNEKRIANALSDCGYTCGGQIMVDLKRYRPWYVPLNAPIEITLDTDPLLL